MNLLVCPNCGPVNQAHIVKRSETIVVRRQPITAMTPVRICNACGESIFHEDLDSASLDRIYEVYRQEHHE